MKKIFLFVCVIIFLFNTRYSFGEEKTKEKYEIKIYTTSQEQQWEKLEVILFKNLINPVENLAEKLTGANIVTPDSIEYIFSDKEYSNIKLKILKYSFLRLELSIYFH